MRLATALFCVSLVLAAIAARPASAPAAEPAPAKIDEAADRGLEYLARQQRDDGSFDAEQKNAGPELLKMKPAATALSLLAFLSEGHMPDMGRYGLAVRGAMDYLVSKVPDDGYVGSVDGSRMYGQAIVTLALSEAYGVETAADNRRQERAAIQKLVAVVLKAQDVSKAEAYAGGWRFEPDSVDSDITVSCWNALALRAAQEAGFPVPGESLKRAAAFIARCYDPNSKTFAYQPGGERRLAATAAGVLCLFLLDAKPEDRGKAERATRFLAEHPIDEQDPNPFDCMFFVTQAGFHASDSAWQNISGATLTRLVKTQNTDGSWFNVQDANKAKTGESGKIYCTAMAILTLSVPQRLLPIFQR
jgi:hypothetical protein